MQIDLSDKLVIVSGFIVGIGFVIVSGFVVVGVIVVVNGCSQVVVDCVIVVIWNGQLDVRVCGVVGDLGMVEGCVVFVVVELKVDILVNNLGIFELKDFFDIEDVEWSCFFEVNVMFGVCLVCVYVLGMVECGWG